MSSIIRSQLFAYGILSTGITIALVSHVYNQRLNFYATAVQLAGNSGSLIVMTNFLAFICITAGYMFKSIFFGTLRTIEIENFYDKSWFFITESMLALTFFREDLNPPFVAMFIALYFLRSFHWITNDRIDHMDQTPPPGPTRLTHLRTTVILIFFLFWDTVATLVCLGAASVGKEGLRGRTALGGLGGSVVLFGAEFAITLTTGLRLSADYIIKLIDLWKARGREDAPVWEGKSMAGFYVGWVCDSLRLIIYAIYFYTIFSLYGSIPLNHVHSLYTAVRSFFTRTRDLMKYRMATKDMDSKYPDATEEDLRGMGGESCVICREEMRPGGARGREGQGEREGPNDTPKRLGCGHVFHFHCLRSWLERQQSCPTCRRTVLSTGAPVVPAPPPAAAAVPPPPPPAPGATPQPPIPPQMVGPLATMFTGQPHVEGQARAPPNGPVGLWSTVPVPVPVPHHPGTNTDHPQRPGTFGRTITPAPSVTPLTSQAPTVFRPLGQVPDSTVAETPAQLAAAAAMRRLQNMADKESASTDIARLKVAPTTSNRPYLVPAFTDQHAPTLTFDTNPMARVSSTHGRSTPDIDERQRLRTMEDVLDRNSRTQHLAPGEAAALMQEMMDLRRAIDERLLSRLNAPVTPTLLPESFAQQQEHAGPSGTSGQSSEVAQYPREVAGNENPPARYVQATTARESSVEPSIDEEDETDTETE